VSESWLFVGLFLLLAFLHLHCSGVTMLIPNARESAVFDDITKSIFLNLPLHNVINRTVIKSHLPLALQRLGDQSYSESCPRSVNSSLSEVMHVWRQVVMLVREVK
jgi:hypothetical protein